MKTWKWVLGFWLVLCGTASAEQGFVQLDVGRGDARMPVYVMSHAQARATLILLPGGNSATGEVVDGKPRSGNFLSRSRAMFVRAGYNVMVVYRPTDLSDLDYGYRISAQHIGELRLAIDYAKKTFGKPVWLVGTSRGTVSGTAAAIALGPEQVAGLVLTSSVTRVKAGAIATQDLAQLRIPVLVVHHSKDACKFCVPDEARQIPALLTQAPKKDFLLIEGGSDPKGNVCEAKHWHGFINFEAETVAQISDWITKAL